MYSMSCDHPEGCSAELEADYGGSWLYDSPEQGRTAAYDHDWVTDGNGKDYCWDHRANVPEYADAHWTVSCEPGCRHRCPACRMGLVTHLECDPRCEVHQSSKPDPNNQQPVGCTSREKLIL